MHAKAVPSKLHQINMEEWVMNLTRDIQDFMAQWGFSADQPGFDMAVQVLLALSASSQAKAE